MITTNCIYSNPVDYQGNPPSNNITPFAFTTLVCTDNQNLFATPSGTQSSTTSASFDIDTRLAFGQTIWIFSFAIMLALIYLGWKIGIWIFRR
jgi:hypothetical protein